jgi:hypothetical protein
MEEGKSLLPDFGYSDRRADEGNQLWNIISGAPDEFPDCTATIYTKLFAAGLFFHC